MRSGKAKGTLASEALDKRYMGKARSTSHMSNYSVEPSLLRELLISE